MLNINKDVNINTNYNVENVQSVDGKKAPSNVIVPPANNSVLKDLNEKIEIAKPSVELSHKKLDNLATVLPLSGIAILALIEQMFSESIKQNRDEAYKTQMSLADSMQAQAGKLKEKATLVLVGGVLGGMFDISGGLISSIGMSRAYAKFKNDDLLLQKQSNFINAFTKGTDFTGKISKSLPEYFASMQDVELKEFEANEKRVQASVEHLKSVNESLQQTVAKAIENYAVIARTQNDTLARILG